MSTLSDHRLDRLLREAYPRVEVSSDFTLRLWRRLMNQIPAGWGVPVSLVAVFALLGILAGIGSVFGTSSGTSLQQLDLFGNAPHDSLAGAVLDLMSGGGA